MDKRILKVPGTHIPVKKIANCINMKENLKIYKADLIIIIVKCPRSLMALLNIFLL